ncbi:MAG: CDP-glycerol glycerophosphotransferase family protein [Proteobacteria bacterium]|nr:CDP-glycerol glycerophosphotransferase family protein [Pseudomonadota bacterium]
MSSSSKKLAAEHQGGEGGDGRVRIGFLFNHESVHQVAHSAPIITELVRHHPEVQVSILVSTEAQMEAVRRIVETEVLARIDCIRLKLNPLYSLISFLTRKVSPFARYAILKSNLSIFRGFDALLVPEKTSLMLKKRFGLDSLKLIYTQHGSGDRAVGFKPEIGDFDFVLLMGRKVRDRMQALGYIRDDQYKIVGYPKFDTIPAGSHGHPRLFSNDNPVVLYNPHFEPGLSSWYDMGQDVLEFFSRHPDYNLILAPHVMLFRRRLHTSLEFFTMRLRQGVPAKYRRCENILVDTGSPACVDMTYTRAADIYIGDVSSQIYEFLIEPRPCIFLNSHNADWQDDPNYLHWQSGPVLTDVAELDARLAQATEEHEHYRSIQESLVAYTFDHNETSASRRAADAIANFTLGKEDAALAANDARGDNQGCRPRPPHIAVAE